MFNWFNKENSQKSLGLKLKPGDNHYRAYVGPPEDYDLVSAMVFNLLTCIGLRQHHRVLDIGCGSLRVGRLLIPYLNKKNYYGIEPNRWLVEDGIQNEIGTDLTRIKQPTFSFKDSLLDFEDSLQIDFSIAQSIFSHCGEILLENWLMQISFHLKDDGILLATFLIGENDSKEKGWVYPECVKYTVESMKAVANKCGLDFELIDWAHPRQSWAIFSKPEFDRKLVSADEPISWNRFVRN